MTLCNEDPVVLTTNCPLVPSAALPVYNTPHSLSRASASLPHHAEAAAAAAEAAEAAGGEEGAADAAPAAPAAAVDPGLPRGVVKKIIMLDPEVQRVSADALWLVGEAARLFLQALAAKGGAALSSKKRKTIMLQDFETLVRWACRLGQQAGAAAAEAMGAACCVYVDLV